MIALIVLVLLASHAEAESATAFVAGEGLVLRLSKLTTADHHFSLDPYCGLLCEPEFAWRMATPRLWWWALFPGEEWMASGWSFVVMANSGWRQLCVKVYDTPELVALLQSAVRHNVHVQGQLTWGVPLVTRLASARGDNSSIGDAAVADVDDATVFVPGVPLGLVVGADDVRVYTHITFVVHYYWDTSGANDNAVYMLGVEALPSGAQRVAASLFHSYSVTWRAADPRLAARFPARVPVSHYEWFPAANSFVLLFSAFLSVCALLARAVPLLDTERRVAALVGRHMAVAPAKLPVWGVLYYVLVAVALYCVGSVALVGIVTAVVLQLRVSVLYRLATSGFAVVALGLSLLGGYAALPVSSWALHRWPALSITSVLPVAAASSWAASLAFIWWNTSWWM